MVGTKSSSARQLLMEVEHRLPDVRDVAAEDVVGVLLRLSFLQSRIAALQVGG